MKVIISGAGIAGLSVAGVLAKQGHEVTVFERQSAPTQIGAGIICFPNAALVLRHLGLEEAVQRVAGQPRIMRRLSSTGDELGDLPIEAINQHIGAPSYSILRADLLRIVARFAERQGARLEYGKQVEGVSASGALLLQDGREHRGDWLIAADGRMNSPLRRYVVDDASARYGGFVNWIGITRAASDVFEPHTVFDIWGEGERFGVVPISARLAYFAGGAAAPLARSTHGPGLYALRKRFVAWPEPVRCVLQHADATSLNEIYVHDHDPGERWYRNNVLLVGDAAHAPLPSSGQGACQALEDAYHIDHLLRSGTPLQPEIFFQRFTLARSQKANAIIQTGRTMAASLFTTDPHLIRERNQQSRHTDFAQAAAGIARLWGSGLPS